MKKQLFFLCITITTFISYAQTSIPNSGFEFWTTGSMEFPQYYVDNSNIQLYYESIPFNMKKSNDAFHGAFSLELKTVEEGMRHQGMGYVLNTVPDSDDPQLWKGGIPYSEIPTGIRFYYKYNTPAVDSALVIFVFRKNNQVLGMEFIRFGGSKTEFTLFDYNFPHTLTEAPDSIIFGFVSSDFRYTNQHVVGSTLIVDSVSFKGVVAQPMHLNGDFENWDVYNFPTTLDGWGKAGQNDGVYRTTDAKTGNYAVELLSYEGVERADEEDEIGTPRTWPGWLTTGYWDKGCNCMVGGTPFQQALDTLSFWYKYSPMLNDEADIWLTFRKNGQVIGNAGRRLTASENYKHEEILIELNQTPDTVLIQINSSLWSNVALGYAGSRLVIDDMYFKSDYESSSLPSLNYEKIKVWPNPVTDQLNFSKRVEVIALYDVSGRKVLSDIGFMNAINTSGLSKGLYFIVMKHSGIESRVSFVK